MPPSPLKVFLCHAHADRDPVRGLYTRLTQDGVDAWLDKAKLFPGQDWELEIRKAVREADVVVVCLSKQFNQAGFRQKEVRLALDTAMEKPEGEIFIIPARLEECDNLESLRKWHWVDLFEDDGYEILMRALQARANSIGVTRSIIPLSFDRKPDEKGLPMSNKSIFEIRIQQLQEHLEKDLLLLKRYEDALRFEKDPKQQMYFEESIASMKDIIVSRQNEYKKLVGLASGSEESNSKDVKNYLENIGRQIDNLSQKVENMDLTLNQQMESLSEKIITQMSSMLEQEQVDLRNYIKNYSQSNVFSAQEIEKLLQEVRNALASISEHEEISKIMVRYPYLSSVKEVIDSPHLDVSHKVKIAIPLVPFFVSYEGELGLGNSANLENLWETIKRKISKTGTPLSKVG